MEEGKGQVTRCYVARQEARVFEIYLVLLLDINNRILDSISGHQFIRNSSIILSRIRFDKLGTPRILFIPTAVPSKNSWGKKNGNLLSIFRDDRIERKLKRVKNKSSRF